jgi:hypothetical protein
MEVKYLGILDREFLLHQKERKREGEKLSNWLLAFLRHPAIPFENKQSERDIQLEKLKLKILGTFCSKCGSNMFCVMHSFLSTTKKQSGNILSTIEDTILGQNVSLFSH